MNNQGPYQARMFAALAQNNLMGVAFGYWMAFNPNASDHPFAAAMIFAIWIGAGWLSWVHIRRFFWPEDFR